MGETLQKQEPVGLAALWVISRKILFQSILQYGKSSDGGFRGTKPRNGFSGSRPVVLSTIGHNWVYLRTTHTKIKQATTW